MKIFMCYTTIVCFIFMPLILGCTPPPKNEPVKPGVEVLLDKKLALISGKRIGLITNATGITSDFRSTIDVLHQEPSVKLMALFGPEHGVRGDIEGGQQVPQYVDPQTGVTVYSLYGVTKKPTPEMLQQIDVLIYDIQDVGSRAYTYIYTMALAMEAAREAGLPFIVLDRPNPLGGNMIDGNVLEPEFKSFIGMYPIPYIYGMTVGELAQLFNKEFQIECNLTVVPMSGWRRSMLFSDTGLPWVPTSPHVPHADTPFFLAATGCIGELGTISEGVGYTSPFEFIGAPWIDGNRLANELNMKKLPGVHFQPTSFKPYYMKFINTQCSGVQIHILDRKVFQPYVIQTVILSVLCQLYPEQGIFNGAGVASFDKACGTDKIRKELLQGTATASIIASWEQELNTFLKVRNKYLIYN